MTCEPHDGLGTALARQALPGAWAGRSGGGRWGRRPFPPGRAGLRKATTATDRRAARSQWFPVGTDAITKALLACGSRSTSTHRDASTTQTLSDPPWCHVKER